MKRNDKARGVRVLFGGLVLSVLGFVPLAQAKINLNKPLDTRKALYVRKSGTPVYKNTKRTGTRVYTYRRRDGVVVRTFVRPHRQKSRTYTRAPYKTPRRHIKR